MQVCSPSGCAKSSHAQKLLYAGLGILHQEYQVDPVCGGETDIRVRGSIVEPEVQALYAGNESLTCIVYVVQEREYPWFAISRDSCPI